MAYIDTSVMVAYYCPEPLSNAAERALRQADRPTISPLVEVEFCSALAIKMRTGDMEIESAHRILTCFRLHIADGLFTMVSIAAREYAAACAWISAFAVPLRTVDALHLAAALANGLAVLTADKALARSAEHFGVACQLIS